MRKCIDFSSFLTLKKIEFDNGPLKFRWFLCAMTENCIAPIGAERNCGNLKRAKDAYKTYKNCHRFDQVKIYDLQSTFD